MCILAAAVAPEHHGSCVCACEGQASEAAAWSGRGPEGPPGEAGGPAPAHAILPRPAAGRSGAASSRPTLFVSGEAFPEAVESVEVEECTTGSRLGDQFRKLATVETG